MKTEVLDLIKQRVDRLEELIRLEKVNASAHRDALTESEKRVAEHEKELASLLAELPE